MTFHGITASVFCGTSLLTISEISAEFAALTENLRLAPTHLAPPIFTRTTHIFKSKTRRVSFSGGSKSTSNPSTRVPLSCFLPSCCFECKIRNHVHAAGCLAAAKQPENVRKSDLDEIICHLHTPKPINTVASKLESLEVLKKK